MQPSFQKTPRLIDSFKPANRSSSKVGPIVFPATTFNPAVGDMSAGVDSIRSALQQSGVHVLGSPAGQLDLCQRSFEELKETV